jgi:6-phosphogluconolactonase
MILTFIQVLAMAQDGRRHFVYAGTFSERGSEGIYVFRFDNEEGELQLIQTVAGRKSPSFLDISPKSNSLYAVQREGLDNKTDTGSVAAYRIMSSSGKLAKINEQSSYGVGPCHISVDPKGKFAYVAHYGGGSISVIPILKNGALDVASDVTQLAGQSISMPRQAGPHTHCVIPSDHGKFVYAADLGLDKVLVYLINRSTGKLSLQSEASVKPGAGPRHLVLHPKGRYAYLAEEMSSTISAFSVDKSTGALTHMQRVSALPEGYSDNNSCADIHVDPSGRFLYTSNRGHNSLAVHAIDKNDGSLSYSGHEDVKGKRPRNFMIHPDGQFVLVANRDTDEVVIFKRNSENGDLIYSGEKVRVPGVVCLKMAVVK